MISRFVGLSGLAAASVVSMTIVVSSTSAHADTVLTTERVANGLTAPVYVCSPPGDRNRLFIVEQRGTIRILKRGTLLPDFFLDIRGPVRSGGERGLLGLAFDPDYANNGYFYVNYTADVPLGDTFISRFSVDPSDPDLADEDSEVVLLGPINQTFSNHNGGCIQFGPDGMLYIGMGDGGSANDPNCDAQKGGVLLGKMLRIAPDGTIPGDNPFVSDPTIRDEIWSFGLRNPWRFSFDRETGDMYIGDVGQNNREEISWEPAGSPGGLNFGWKMMEGDRCNSTGSCPGGTPPCNDPSLTDPIHVYLQSGNGCSVTGGYVYRGCAIPDLQGTYFFADYCSPHNIWSFRWDGSTITDFQNRKAELDPPGFTISRISSFGEDADGELYIVDLGGEVFKIVSSDPPPPGVDLGSGLAGGSGVEPYLDACGLLDSGNSAALRLRDANPNSSAILFGSLSSTAVNIFGGTLLAFPPIVILFLATDSEGRIEFDVPGGGGPIDLYTQYLIEDAGAPQGYAFSNALLLTFQP